MNDSTNKMIEMLQNQISKRDGAITALKRENDILSIVNKAQKKRYRFAILILTILLMIESGIMICHLI
jgi:hypothetical protein